LGDAFRAPRLKPGATVLTPASPAFVAVAANVFDISRPGTWNLVELDSTPCVSDVLELTGESFASDVTSQPCAWNLVDLDDMPCSSNVAEMAGEAGPGSVAPGFSRGFSNAIPKLRARFSGRQRLRA
jgi:hypothetical protein